MSIVRFGFCLLILIFCVITITSYKIDHHRHEDRNNRAVTEWRFRRNFFRLLPYHEGKNTNDDLVDGETIGNDSKYGGKTYDKKYLPNLSDDIMY
ncbi:unnamed protein product [Rotaria socialis]|nr:unnamed protein product [Rotaria socialis]CAF3424328.1 unnamed protein product [Rotaria socialis]CAF4280636.1 unnamed protein product [Rotaria socialis]CAF4286010.1 unnamed protein product [Rotaria socialis]CAF4316802.1 unnamed protein product [Rotaria socialis]